MFTLLFMLAGCSSGAKWYYCSHTVRVTDSLFLDPEKIIQSSLGQWATYDISITNLSRTPKLLAERERQFKLLFENGFSCWSTIVEESEYDFNWNEPIPPRSTVRAEVYFEIPDYSAQPVGVRFVMKDGQEIDPDMVD